MSYNNGQLSDDLLDVVVGGTEDNRLVMKESMRCTGCGTEIPRQPLSEPCPHCGHVDEQFMPKE